MGTLLFLIYLLPILVGAVLKWWMVHRQTRDRKPVNDSDVGMALARNEEERRFEVSWRAINRHDPRAVDPSQVAHTPDSNLLEHRVMRDRDPWCSEIHFGVDPRRPDITAGADPRRPEIQPGTCPRQSES